ncbi:hypothetical protein GCM10027589_57310 [Actinocorallia lasiicapitis]
MSGRPDPQQVCDDTITRLALAPDATYKEACRRVGELMSELLDAEVSLKFAALGNTPFSGATLRLADSGYIVFVANSRSWYHRLGILLHELAHVLLGHQPATVDALRRTYLPHIPARMAQIIATRAGHDGDDEAEAEELADLLLGRITERQASAAEPTDSAGAQVKRIAEGLAHRPAEGRPPGRHRAPGPPQATGRKPKRP